MFVTHVTHHLCAALSVAIRGQDWMDVGKAIWNTLPFWELPSELMPGLQDVAGLNGLGF